MVPRGWPGDGKHKLRLPTSQAILELLLVRNRVWLLSSLLLHLSFIFRDFVVLFIMVVVAVARVDHGREVGGEWQTQPVFLRGHSWRQLREVSSAILSHYKSCDFGGVACFGSGLESGRTASEVPTGSMAGEGSRCARSKTRGHRFSIAIFIFVVSALWIRRANFGVTVLHATDL